MELENIYHFFQSPSPVYLNKELAVCYILNVLLVQDSYATELLQMLAHCYSSYLLSDTVLYEALQFLEEQSVISFYSRKAEGRGRPRRMCRINSAYREDGQNLARLWEKYVEKNSIKSVLSK